MIENAKFKEAEYRENQIGTQFVSCPADEVIRVFINGEITSAENFPQAELFLSYKISLPLGWKSEISEQFYALDLTDQEMKELNCLESITQSTLPIFEKNKDGELITKFYFCFPIDLQLLKKDNATEWPNIHFQVFSKDHWDRILMHGCGFAKFPQNPGHHQIQIETWKPVVDLRTRISQYFLGGLIKPKNLEDISKSQIINQMDQSAPVNRYHYRSMSAGRISLMINTAIQSKKLKTDERVHYRDFKFSQQTEQKKKQLSQNIPSMVNTGNVLGSRFTNNKL